MKTEKTLHGPGPFPGVVPQAPHFYSLSELQLRSSCFSLCQKALPSETSATAARLPHEAKSLTMGVHGSVFLMPQHLLSLQFYTYGHDYLFNVCLLLNSKVHEGRYRPVLFTQHLD